MQSKHFLGLCLGLVQGALSAQSQGTFQNLNFEAANVPSGTPAGSFVSVTAAFPGWTAYLGTNQATSVLYNTLYVGTATEAILGTNAAVSGPIQGRYTAVLQAGLGDQGSVSASIAQVGLVPATAASLRFLVSMGTGPFEVSVGGHTLPTVLLSQNGGIGTYGADISAFAGQTQGLRFTALAPSYNLYLDGIQFSSTPIPEPGNWSLLLCGAVIFGIRGWRRQAGKRRP
jgi:hypothetical protein